MAQGRVMDAKQRHVRDLEARAKEGTCTDLYRKQLMYAAAKEQKIVDMDSVCDSSSPCIV